MIKFNFTAWRELLQKKSKALQAKLAVIRQGVSYISKNDAPPKGTTLLKFYNALNLTAAELGALFYDDDGAGATASPDTETASPGASTTGHDMSTGALTE